MHRCTITAVELICIDFFFFFNILVFTNCKFSSGAPIEMLPFIFFAFSTIKVSVNVKACAGHVHPFSIMILFSYS